MELLRNHDLKKHNTFQVGGKAAWASLPATLEDLQETLRWAKEQTVPFRVIGYGSNVLVSDEGYDGVIILLSELDAATSFRWLKEGQIWSAGAWVSMKKLSNELLKAGCSDFLKFSGIPGTLGGAIKMNAGCYGGEMSDYIKTVEIMNSSGTVHKAAKEELGFAYRSSAIGRNEIVLSAEFEAREFAGEEEIVLLKERIKKSRENQPLGTKNAGSVFKNGVDYIAAKLIDEAGLKGLSVGDAEVSTKHANFIVNRGNAKAMDIYQLICLVEEKVYEKFGVTLQREVELIGAFS